MLWESGEAEERLKYWATILNCLGAAGNSLGLCEVSGRNGLVHRVDARTCNGKRFIVEAESLTTAMTELEISLRRHGKREEK